jgi:hypothetical protein
MAKGIDCAAMHQGAGQCTGDVPNSKPRRWHGHWTDHCLGRSVSRSRIWGLSWSRDASIIDLGNACVNGRKRSRRSAMRRSRRSARRGLIRLTTWGRDGSPAIVDARGLAPGGGRYSWERSGRRRGAQMGGQGRPARAAEMRERLTLTRGWPRRALNVVFVWAPHAFAATPYLVHDSQPQPWGAATLVGLG